MVKPHDFVVDLRHIDKEDSHYVGGKSANLGEMIASGFPVPGGFVVTAHAYFTFIKHNKLDTKIKHLLGTVNYDNPDSLAQVTSKIRSLIKKADIPSEISKAVFKEYHRQKSPYVAIRSSATSEDSKEASFAGQNETFLNIKGEAAVIDTIRQAWSSLYNARAAYYRHQNKLDKKKTGIALVVQHMVESDASGIMFTIDPIENDKSKVIIEAIYGLGEYIVSGKITPDHYELSKTDKKITSKHIANQDVKLVRKGHNNEQKKVSKLNRKKQKISDEQIKKLFDHALKLEKHYYFPQDIEWAIEKGKIFIVQTRPITTLGKKGENDATRQISKAEHPILIGDPASPGIGTGEVTILKSPKDMTKLKKGDVLVALFTNPDFVPAMQKASAIVTERGGRTSHAAIVSREFGIPAIVGAKNATKILKSGSIVTVDGRHGRVYKGSPVASEKHIEVVTHSHKKTKTKIYVNLGEPDLAEKISEYPVDGIGLLRAEFMIAGIGIHPKKLIEEKKQKVFITTHSQNLEKFAKAFYPRPILYRATDFKTNEYRHLIGGKSYEPSEVNPMIGYRGAFRYIRDKKVFDLELEAIKKVREKYNNISLMIPFVRNLKELIEVKHLIAAAGLRRSSTFKLFMMVEVPSNVILIEDFIKAGIDGVSIGSNDLTMLTLGIDRDNEEVAVEFDERNPALIWSFKRVVNAAKKHKIEVGICGQAPSVYPDITEMLVKEGINSISVSPDVVDSTRELVYQAENT